VQAPLELTRRAPAALFVAVMAGLSRSSTSCDAATNRVDALVKPAHDEEVQPTARIPA